MTILQSVLSEMQNVVKPLHNEYITIIYIYFNLQKSQYRRREEQKIHSEVLATSTPHDAGYFPLRARSQQEVG